MTHFPTLKAYALKSWARFGRSLTFSLHALLRRLLVCGALAVRLMLMDNLLLRLGLRVVWDGGTGLPLLDGRASDGLPD